MVRLSCLSLVLTAAVAHASDPSPDRVLDCVWQTRCIETDCGAIDQSFALDLFHTTAKQADRLPNGSWIAAAGFDWDGQRHEYIGYLREDGGFSLNLAPGRVGVPFLTLRLTGDGQLRLAEMAMQAPHLTTWLGTCLLGMA